jgi:hypothetical protein
LKFILHHRPANTEPAEPQILKTFCSFPKLLGPLPLATGTDA